jgi:FtsH-binding integral membrane protein
MYAQTQTRRLGAMEAMARGIPAELATFVRKTYGLLAFAVLLACGACAAMIEFMPTQPVTFRDGTRGEISSFPQWGIWALWGGMFVFGIMGSMARKGARQGEASLPGLLALIGMVVCGGAMLGPTIGSFIGLGMAKTVMAAAATTAVTFTALTAYVMITGHNFRFLGGFLFVTFWAFFAAWILSGWLFPGVQWYLAAFGALLFSAFILYDTSSVIHFYGPNNLVVPAVISLFLDIFNLFIMLLVLFSGRRD